MRLPVVLLAVSLLGVVGGAWLIGRWAVGCAVIFDSLCAAAYAVWGYDDGQDAQQPQAVELPAVDVLERARRAS